MTEQRVRPPTPLWVKVFGLIALVLVVMFAVLHLAGGGLGNHFQP